jgi:hypothetical protein
MIQKIELSQKCLKWGFDEWNDFDNPIFQAQFQNLSESEQEKILMQKKLFWDCYNGNKNPISEDDKYAEPEGGYEEFLEETRKKQERYIKDRGASFVFYHSFIEALGDMNDKQFRECILALCDYGLYQKKGEYKGLVKMYMIQAMPQLDANERNKLIARQNGLKGGAPEGNQNARKTTKTTNWLIQNNLKQPTG